MICLQSEFWGFYLVSNQIIMSIECFVFYIDLLEKGRTTGFSGRLLTYPDQRKAIEQAEREELEREQREKEQKANPDKPPGTNTKLAYAVKHNCYTRPDDVTEISVLDFDQGSLD
mgnify:FL=1